MVVWVGSEEGVGLVLHVLVVVSEIPLYSKWIRALNIALPPYPQAKERREAQRKKLEEHTMRARRVCGVDPAERQAEKPRFIMKRLMI